MFCQAPNPDRLTIERAIEQLVRTWTDGLAEALMLVHDPVGAQQLIRRYRDAFPLSYREAYPARRGETLFHQRLGEREQLLVPADHADRLAGQRADRAGAEVA